MALYPCLAYDVVNFDLSNRFVRAFLVARTVKNPPAMREIQIQSLGWEDPLEEGVATHSSILAMENPYGQRSLAGCSPCGRKESDMTLSD